jgi:hypothetical protein
MKRFSIVFFLHFIVTNIAFAYYIYLYIYMFKRSSTLTILNQNITICKLSKIKATFSYALFSSKLCGCSINTYEFSTSIIYFKYLTLFSFDMYICMVYTYICAFFLILFTRAPLKYNCYFTSRSH